MWVIFSFAQGLKWLWVASIKWLRLYSNGSDSSQQGERSPSQSSQGQQVRQDIDRLGNQSINSDVQIDSQVFRAPMTQESRDRATGYQTQMEGTAYIGGTHIHGAGEEVQRPFYLPFPYNRRFVGREVELRRIEEAFALERPVAITALAGMGGVGKTELAVQYAYKHEGEYEGGVCWLSLRESELAAAVVQFFVARLGREVPQRDVRGNSLSLVQQAQWCWQNWQPSAGQVLVVLDDVTSGAGLQEALPNQPRFRVLLTTREMNLAGNFEQLELEVLDLELALAFLQSIVTDGRIAKQGEAAKELCKMLGCLPLGLELAGRYL